MGEVLGPKGDDSIMNQFDALFQRPEYRRIDPNPVIYRRAGEYRKAFGLKLPDATHLATATLLHVHELHSFDGDLLKLDGKAEILPTRIRKPSAPQKSLPL
jgi:predicted nucleic acid-binding protein